MFFRNSKLKAAYYQCYANINPHTCEACLLRHGALFSNPAAVPPMHEGCRCQLLPVPSGELKERKLQTERMQAKAQAELRRRTLFAEAMQRLDEDRELALKYLKESVMIDIYIEELESLHERHQELLESDLALIKTLRKLFITAYFDKMDQPKYQCISAGMYGQLETQGRKRIQALFADPTPQ